MNRRNFINNAMGVGIAVSVPAIFSTIAQAMETDTDCENVDVPAVPDNLVDPDTDPTAMALKYVHNAENADRVSAKRPGLAPDEQLCDNCQFSVESDCYYVGCSLFPGKLVSPEGWCMSWTLKSNVGV